MVSESESDEPRNTSDEGNESEAEEPVTRARGRAKKKKEFPPIEFEEAWKRIEAIQRDVANKKKKLSTKPNWIQIFAAVEKEALANGFEEEVLGTLWQIVSSASAQIITARDKCTLILLMIPKSKIRAQFVKRMLWWTTSETHASFTSTKAIALAMLKYFHGLVEYSLIEGELFTIFNYTNLFTLITYDSLGEWLFILLKSVTTRDNFQRFQVTLALEKWKGAETPALRRSLHSILKKYKILKPQWIPENVFAAPTLAAKKSSSKIIENFRKRLYEAKRRLCGLARNQSVNEATQDSQMEVDDSPAQDEYDPQRLHHQNFFPDLCPTFDMNTWKDVAAGTVTGPSVALWVLLERERLILFVQNEELLEHLETYLRIFFCHKMSSYTDRENHRYEFVLTRCFEVSVLLNRGLAAVDDWLPEFLLEWDFVLWYKHILRLLPFLNPFEFVDGYQVVLRKLEIEFIFASPMESIVLWDALEELLFRWLEKLKSLEVTVEEGNDEYEEDWKFVFESVVQLYKFLDKILNKYIALNLSNPLCEPLVLAFIKTFVKLQTQYKNKDTTFVAVPPLSIVYASIVLDSARLFDGIAEYLILTKGWSVPRVTEDTRRLQTLNKVFKEFVAGGIPFNELFQKELDAGMQVSLQPLLSAWTLEHSLSLDAFRSKEPGTSGQLKTGLMAELLPNFLKYYESLRHKAFMPGHASTPAATGRKTRTIVPRGAGGAGAAFEHLD